MADMDDGPDQLPLADGLVQDTVLGLVGNGPYDLVLTHGPFGEYTRHLRHEEVSRAVVALWTDGRLRAGRLWMFAYEDGGGRYLPRADRAADRIEKLSDDVWREKYRIITEVYGFGAESLEARTTPREEAFRCFRSPADVRTLLKEGGQG
jgi:hypothetical protein